MVRRIGAVERHKEDLGGRSKCALIRILIAIVVVNVVVLVIGIIIVSVVGMSCSASAQVGVQRGIRFTIRIFHQATEDSRSIAVVRGSGPTRKGAYIPSFRSRDCPCGSTIVVSLRNNASAIAFCISRRPDAGTTTGYGPILGTH